MASSLVEVFCVALKLATPQRQVPPAVIATQNFNTFSSVDWKTSRLTDSLCCAGLRMSLI